MNFVVQTGGKQYLVQKGTILDIEKLDVEAGKKVALDLLMTIDDKDGITVGSPLIEGKKVEAKIVEHFRGVKLRVFKYKRRKRYRKSQGHRQSLTKIEIVGIK